MGLKLVFEPTIQIVGRQTIDEDALRDFQNGGTWKSDSIVPAEALSEIAGRTCYMSFSTPRPGGNRTYLKHIIESGHGNILEHASWGLLVSGVSRSLSHELVRHRTGQTPSQLSQRYVDESDCEFVVPPDLKIAVKASLVNGVSTQNGTVIERFLSRHDLTERDFLLLAEEGKNWLDAVKFTQRQYNSIVEQMAKRAESKGLLKTEARKFARQAARSVLPNATETKLYLTINARAARHIIEQRCSRHADPEIRVYAGKLWEKLLVEAPNIFGDYEKVPLPDGTFEVTTLNRKV